MAIVGIIGSVLGAAIGLLGKCFSDALERRFKYLCCFDANVQSHNEEVTKLGRAKADVVEQVEAAGYNVQLVSTQATAWLADANAHEQNFDDQVSNISCWSVKRRYLASKTAFDTAEAIKKMREDLPAIKEQISNPPHPASMVPDNQERPPTEFWSRKENEEKLMALLKNEDVKMLGIWGMGGVGKTTLAKKMKAILTNDVFNEKLGVQIEFWDLGRQIAEKCKGLPLALVSVAGALKGQKEQGYWEDVLHQLNGSCPNDLPEVLNEVYIPLKLSYDSLRIDKPNVLSTDNARNHVQSILLLCSLFPEDFYIPLEVLTFYAMGLREFEGMGNLEQVRNRIEALVGNLKSRFLLLDCLEGQGVRMHDVVRDVAIYIASEGPEMLIKRSYDSIWISPFVRGERIEMSEESIFPNLRLLLINETSIDKDSDTREIPLEGMKKDKDSDTRDIHLEGMEKLNVLSIMQNSSLTSLRLTTQDLGTLILENCYSLKTISVVGELLNLKILICCHCYAIEEIASKISSLDEKNFEMIFPKLESLQLSNLPELAVFCQRIESIKFPRLSQIDIKNCPRLEGLLSSSGGICRGDDDSLRGSGKKEGKKKVSFGKLGKLQVDWIRNCEVFFSQIRKDSFTHLKELTVRNCTDTKILFPFSIAESLSSLKFLTIEGCGELEKVIEDEEMEGTYGSALDFPLLEDLDLRNLPKLEIFGTSALELPKLVYMNIWDCPKSGGFNLGSLRAQNMKSLNGLRINNCGMMEQVSLWNEENESRHITITFPKLERLRLSYLWNLTVVYQGIQNIEPTLLTQLHIKGGSSFDARNIHNCNHSLHLLYKQKISFCNYVWRSQIPIASLAHLVTLAVESCDNIHSLFSFSIAQTLTSLKILCIERCRELVKVIEDEEEECSHDATLLFPHLQELHLSDLPKLNTFCKAALGLPKLVNLEISNCHKMGGLNMGSLATPNLESLELLKISSCDMMMEGVFLWSEEEYR